MVIHFGKRLSTGDKSLSGVMDVAMCMDVAKPMGSLRLSAHIPEVTCKRCLSFIKRSMGEV